MSSTVAKGKELEQRIFDILRSIEIECKWTGVHESMNRKHLVATVKSDCERSSLVLNDDDTCTHFFTNVFIVVRVTEEWISAVLLLGSRPSVIREFEGALTRQTRGTIGVVVGRSKNRFTPGAIVTAKTSIYDIILTDKKDLCIDLIQLVADRLNRSYDNLLNVWDVGLLNLDFNANPPFPSPMNAQYSENCFPSSDDNLNLVSVECVL
ncbi:2230_t:CDS:2 [Funneliformis caledonium]|uniref:2230_t:CDS:1 n=1 Tax=Funneliformis caledonium TaxID=1117310 RepID=A0A9N9BQ11_9GLOM|nr:2230_t:CDS:2 [Funneliformis caledonium]